MALYKTALHHNANATPKWFLETVGVYVSLINGCAYCVDHHFEGLKRLLKDDDRADAIKATLAAAADRGAVETAVLAAKEIEALRYVFLLTTAPDRIHRKHFDALRATGWDDGEILEINQVAAYFAYANRTVLGLGVTAEGDTLGLSPNNSADETDWGHQ